MKEESTIAVPWRVGDDGNVMLNPFDSPLEKFQEPNFKKRSRLLFEIGNMGLDQTRYRLKQDPEAEFARRAIPPKPIEQVAHPADMSQYDGKVGREPNYPRKR